MDIAKAMRVYRAENDLTQRDLAEKAGVTFVTICAAENGRRISKSTLKKIAGAIGMEEETIERQED